MKEIFGWGVLVGVMLTSAFAWAMAPAPFAPDPTAERAALQHLDRCARGYLGARLERAKHIRYVADPSVTRAQTVLPDSVRLDPAWRADEWTLAHEMLHVAIGRPGHPQDIFNRCGLWRPE